MKPTPVWIGALLGLLSLAGPGLQAAFAQAAPDTPELARERERMVREQMAGRDITDQRVLEQMRAVPRHQFVPEAEREHAHVDGPLPIGYGQTISQPYIVAFMTQQLQPKPTDRVLEVGTGSGYQAAVLAALVAEVQTVEIVEPLARAARERLGA